MAEPRKDTRRRPALPAGGPEYRAAVDQFRRANARQPVCKAILWGAAASLSPQGIHDLAIYFSQLPARAANDGDRGLVARGEAIYQRGIPEANIAACVACHGPNAEGVGEIPRSEGWLTRT